ncbi:FecR family protein [Mucilaginibacter limnophilus]|uniref:FecR family protein n=1 Tax=Mucilaginibacter limnophilus TaxID=1932778 RepID=A0A3S2WVZ3_9SPHI|nr:FecR family protein [Mucilaginibacter limnophilus]RVT97355.1 FecR family protein [Mucilaginibacter limnophilus]
MDHSEISLLFKKLVNNQCTKEEADQLMDLLTQKQYEEVFQQLIEEQLKRPEPDTVEIQNTRYSLNLRLKEILKDDTAEIKVIEPKFRTYRFLRTAAVIISCLSISVYFITRNISHEKIVNKDNEISFGSNKAFLTLSNGKKINLEDVANGNIVTQSDLLIKKNSDGLMVCQPNPTAKNHGNSTQTFNTITTPDGGQYQIILADGSKVWLNAASSIKFPSHFAPEERLVELSGEAYFEIVKVTNSHDSKAARKKQPFVVLSKRQKIEVLGTRFNVNDYAEENGVKTTLLHGSVKVEAFDNGGRQKVSQTKILLPGQQAELSAVKFTISTADTASAVAWKEGYFQFDNENIYVVMRKISRWYNVQVEYKGNMQGKMFSGTISKYSHVSDVLKMLQLTGTVSFTIKDRKIIVS